MTLHVQFGCGEDSLKRTKLKFRVFLTQCVQKLIPELQGNEGVRRAAGTDETTSFLAARLT
jgi:hypothetical protein